MKRNLFIAGNALTGALFGIISGWYYAGWYYGDGSVIYLIVSAVEILIGFHFFSKAMDHYRGDLS